MSLSNLSINYGFNGSPSTASLEYKIGEKCRTGDSETPAVGGGAIGTPIDGKLNGFKVASKTIKNSTGFNTHSLELVNTEEKRLSSVIVLVRGISCAPTKSGKYDGIFKDYAASDFLGIGEQDDAFQLTGSIREMSNDVFVLGRSFSTVTATVDTIEIIDEEVVVTTDQYIRTYSNEQIISSVPSESPEPWPIEALDKFEVLDVSVSKRYGYYLKDLKQLIIQAGYSIEGMPTDGDFSILDFGGNLNSVISSVASMYGLYWMCRGNQIIMFPANNELGAPYNETGVDTLDYSIKDDLNKKGYVGTIVGEESPNFLDYSSAGAGSGDPYGRSIRMKNIDATKLFDVRVRSLMYTFYLFFEIDNTENGFDMIFWSLMYKYKKVEDLTYFPINDIVRKYTDDNQPYDFNAIDHSSLDVDLKRLLIGNSSRKKIYKLNGRTNITETEFKGCIARPSNTPLFKSVGTLCASLGEYYVSPRVSKTFAKRHNVTSNDLKIGGPYDKTEKIKNIEEFQNLYNALVLVTDGGEEKLKTITLEQVLNEIQKQEELEQDEKDEAESVIRDGCYYVGFKPIQVIKKRSNKTGKTPCLSKEQIQGDANIIIEVDDLDYNTIFGVPQGDGTNSYFGISQEVATSFIRKSITLIKDVLEKDYTILAEASKFDNDQDTNSYSGTSSGESPEQELRKDFLFKSFSIKVNKPSSYSIPPDMEAVQFSAGLDDIKAIQENISSLAETSDGETTDSITYNGVPSFDPSDTNLAGVSMTLDGSSITTTISRSTRPKLAIDQQLVLTTSKASTLSSGFNMMKARQKNYFGIN
ncbi:hypothetical protein N9955_00860 [bacterium]|nr:hypothetical protein [bacterium]